MATMPLSKDVLSGTLSSCQWILEKWAKKVETGIPGVDLQADDVDVQEFFNEMIGELSLVARHCEGIVDIISGQGI